MADDAQYISSDDDKVVPEPVPRASASMATPPLAPPLTADDTQHMSCENDKVVGEHVPRASAAMAAPPPAPFLTALTDVLPLHPLEARRQVLKTGRQQAGSSAAHSEDFPVSCTLDRSMLLLSLIVSVTVADAGAVHVGVAVPVGVTTALAAAVASAS